jgi:hypothetical protein
MPAQQKRSGDGRILIGIDDEIVAIAPVETFGDDRHALGHVTDEADRIRLQAPIAGDAGASAFNLFLLRDATRHAGTFVAQITRQHGFMAAQTGGFATGADMGDALGDREVPWIEQRFIAHSDQSSLCNGAPAIRPPSITSAWPDVKLPALDAR